MVFRKIVSWGYVHKTREAGGKGVDFARFLTGSSTSRRKINEIKGIYLT